MANLEIDFCGIKSPNPFWLASAPPSNSAYQVQKSFEQGWGGAVWKTIGAPVLNVCNRYGTIDYKGQKIIGLNNVVITNAVPEPSTVACAAGGLCALLGYRRARRSLRYPFGFRGSRISFSV